MSNKKRPDYPNALHHVIARGVAKQKIFSDSNDYQYFLNKLGQYLKCKKVKCFAWVLMPNHFHLLTQRTTIPIEKFMQPFLTSYAMYYNKRHDRPGHLFQNRFKSILCQQDSYFFTLIKYIHRNPLRAKLVKNLDELSMFPWCGHGALLGQKAYDWHDVSAVWDFFNNDHEKAIGDYHKAMLADLTEKELANAKFGTILKVKNIGWKHRDTLTDQEKNLSDVGILGDQYFIRNALSKRNIIRTAHDEDFVFENLAMQAASLCNTSHQLLFTQRRSPSVMQARSIASAWAVDVFQRTPTEIALYLGVSVKTAYRLINRGRQLICSNPGFEYELGRTC